MNLLFYSIRTDEKIATAKYAWNSIKTWMFAHSKHKTCLHTFLFYIYLTCSFPSTPFVYSNSLRMQTGTVREREGGKEGENEHAAELKWFVWKTKALQLISERYGQVWSKRLHFATTFPDVLTFAVIELIFSGNIYLLYQSLFFVAFFFNSIFTFVLLI